jgi:hypothetical protein
MISQGHSPDRRWSNASRCFGSAVMGYWPGSIATKSHQGKLNHLKNTAQRRGPRSPAEQADTGSLKKLIPRLKPIGHRFHARAEGGIGNRIRRYTNGANEPQF